MGSYVGRPKRWRRGGKLVPSRVESLAFRTSRRPGRGRAWVVAGWSPWRHLWHCRHWPVKAGHRSRREVRPGVEGGKAPWSRPEPRL